MSSPPTETPRRNLTGAVVPALAAAIYAGAFAINLLLCFLLIPRMGPMGAAIAIASAMVAESALLYLVAKRRLGIHVFIWRRR